MSHSTGEPTYFLKTNTKVLGPFRLHQLRSLHQRGQLRSEYHVSLDRRQWQPVDELLARAVDAVPTETTSARLPEEEWYYWSDGVEQFGPFSKPALLAQLDEGKLSIDDLVWTEGFDEWVPAGEAFAELLGRRPPPLRRRGHPAGTAGAVPEQPPASARARFCTNCGLQLHFDAPICPRCNAGQPGVLAGASPVATTQYVHRERKDKIAAGLLALFLGGLGIHRFYLGNWIWGLMYLLFCWTFIPGIIAFVEGIVFLCMRTDDFDAKYNR